MGTWDFNGTMLLTGCMPFLDYLQRALDAFDSLGEAQPLVGHMPFIDFLQWALDAFDSLCKAQSLVIA